MDERVGQPEELRNTSFGERLRHLRHLRRLRVRSVGGTPLLDDVAEYARMANMSEPAAALLARKFVNRVSALHDPPPSTAQH